MLEPHNCQADKGLCWKMLSATDVQILSGYWFNPYWCRLLVSADISCRPPLEARGFWLWVQGFVGFLGRGEGCERGS